MSALSVLEERGSGAGEEFVNFFESSFAPLRRDAKSNPPPPSPPALSDDHLAGIVVASVAGVLLIGALVVGMWRWCQPPEEAPEEVQIGARVKRRGFPGVLRMAGRDVTATELQALLPQAAVVARHTNDALAKRAVEEKTIRKPTGGTRWGRRR